VCFIFFPFILLLLILMLIILMLLFILICLVPAVGLILRKMLSMFLRSKRFLLLFLQDLVY